MYKLTGILLILIIVAFGGYSWWQSAIEAATTIKAPTNQGLVGYWSFEEATGTKATDFSGKGNMGTLTGMANPATATSGWGSGRLGGGLNFDGVNDYVSVPTISISSGITVSAWVYSSNFNQNGFIVGKNPVNSQWELFFQGTNLIWRGSALNDNVMCLGGAASNNAWHHIVGKQTGNQGTLYIDGVQCATADTSAPIGNGAGVVEIGRFNDGYYFSGSIDEVRIYNRALSATEITKLYQSGAAKIKISNTTKINASQNGNLTSGLVGMWSFNGLDVTDKVYDRSGQNNNGYFIGGATSSAKVIGKVGQALDFNGTTNYISAAAADTNYLGAITIAAWVKPTDNVGSNIASKCLNNGATYNMFDFALTTISSVKVFYSVRAGTGSYRSYKGASWTTGVWQHVVVTYANGNLATAPIYYLNGVAASATVINAGTGTVAGNGKPILLGARDDAKGTTGLKGSLDEVRIYNRALTAGEILLLYNLGR